MNTLNQDYQKSIIAFAAGLILGGFLVWVFSGVEEVATPTDSKLDTTSEVMTEEVDTPTEGEVVMLPIGAGEITVLDYAAGSSVPVAVVEYPDVRGWVAVREVAEDGTYGNVLGATKYDVEAGRLPSMVKLMRDTVVGGAYTVVFYTNDEDFNLDSISMVDGPHADFIAQ